jgi:hypothetical protein
VSFHGSFHEYAFECKLTDFNSITSGQRCKANKEMLEIWCGCFEVIKAKTSVDEFKKENLTVEQFDKLRLEELNPRDSNKFHFK